MVSVRGGGADQQKKKKKKWLLNLFLESSTNLRGYANTAVILLNKLHRDPGWNFVDSKKFFNI